MYFVFIIIPVGISEQGSSIKRKYNALFQIVILCARSVPYYKLKFGILIPTVRHFNRFHL